MKKNILLCAALVALTACNGNSDNNKSLDYETIDVNFNLKSELEIPEGTEFGVVALCARDGQQGVNMGKSLSLHSKCQELQVRRDWPLLQRETRSRPGSRTMVSRFMQYRLIKTMWMYQQCRCLFLPGRIILTESSNIFRCWL